MTQHSKAETHSARSTHNQDAEKTLTLSSPGVLKICLTKHSSTMCQHIINVATQKKQCTKHTIDKKTTSKHKHYTLGEHSMQPQKDIQVNIVK